LFISVIQFRFEFSGTEDRFEDIRAVIVDCMCKNPAPFAAYVGQDLNQYLSTNTLQPPKWGTDVEITAAATVLQTPVVVFTATTEHKRAWLEYKPLFRLSSSYKGTENLYLRNLCSHYEPVVSVD
jgi:hypothetical protein